MKGKSLEWSIFQYFSLMLLFIPLSAFGSEQRDQNFANESKDSTTHIISDNTESFNIFWIQFRQVVLDKKFEEVKSLCIFPIQTRGPLDDDEIVQFKADEFTKVFSVFLDQNSGLNANNIYETEFEYIKRTPNVFAEDLNKFSTFHVRDFARIGSMQFKFVDHEWRLYFLYLEYSTYEKLSTIDE